MNNMLWERTGPDSPCGRYLRRFWHPVFRSCDLRPGRAQRIRALNQYFTLFRGMTGRASLLADRCPHRGTLLSVGAVEGDDLRCHHHGWRFDGTGRCTERPGVRDLPSPQASARAYATVEYLGLVFVWLGDGTAPELPRYAAYEAPGVLRVTPPDLWPCSFFQRIENSCDVAHVAWAHRTSGVAAALSGELEVACEETHDGLNVSMTIDGKELAPVRFRLPNVLEFSTPIAPEVGWRDHLVWRVPVDDGSCLSFSVALVPDSVAGAERFRLDRPLERPLEAGETARLGDEVLRGRARLVDLDSSSLTEIEDYIALVGQGPASERAPEQLGRFDAPVMALRKRWLRELTAIDGSTG